MGNRKTASNVVFVFIVIAFLIAGILGYNKLTQKTYAVYDAVPHSAAFFVDFNSLRNLREELQKNKMWAEFKHLPDIKLIENKFDSWDTIAAKYPNLRSFIKEGKGLFSLHTVNGRNQLLIVFETGHSLNYSSVDDLFNQIYGNTFTRLQSTYEGERIKKIIFNNMEENFSYVLMDNLFIGSLSEELIKESIKHIPQKESILNNRDFKNLHKSAGKNVDANIYLNHQYFSKFLSKLTAQNFKDFSEELADYFSWTGLDIVIKEDELLLNGYSKAADSTHHLLALYQKQKPQAISLPGILPYNTSLMLHFGFENYEQFYHDYKDYLRARGKLNTFQRKIDNFNLTLKTNLEHIFLPLIGNEIALVSYANHPLEFEEKSYAVVKLKDVVNFRNRLAQTHKSVSGSGLVKRYKNQNIYRINKTGMMQVLLGSSFRFIEHCHYTFINGYMIVGNSTAAIQNFIDLYQSGKTLDLNENYKAFTDNIYQESNIYLYYNIRNGFQLMNQYLTTKFYKDLSTPPLKFNNFHAVGFQISNVQGNLFTNVYLKYNAEIVEENKSVWKAALDADVLGQPYTVKNHRNNTYNIAVFDVQNNLYLFDADGNRLWKKQIEEAPMSPIYLVDYYKNGKYQYLFNTKNYLYLIDLLGRDVQGYPRRLSSPAANPLSLFDYSNDKNYRILIAGTDKKIYNYNIKGNEVSGWNKTQTLNPVDGEFRHLINNRRDYIFVADNKGIIKVLNRLGNERIILQKQFGKAKHSGFYVNRTNQKGDFITTNTKGTLTYISSAGNIAETVFGNFSENHFFLYEDFNKNGYKDFIYLDQNKLRVYDRFKKPVFSYEFNSNITQKLVFYNISSSKSLLGVVSDETKEVFLFDNNGKVVISQGLIGETPFAIQSLKNNRELNLVVGIGSSLYNYVIR